MTAIATPCTKVCTLDPVSGLCIGCGRTIDEIARWASLSADERQQIIDALPARMRRAHPGSAARLA